MDLKSDLEISSTDLLISPLAIWPTYFWFPLRGTLSHLETVAFLKARHGTQKTSGYSSSWQEVRPSARMLPDTQASNMGVTSRKWAGVPANCSNTSDTVHKSQYEAIETRNVTINIIIYFIQCCCVYHVLWASATTITTLYLKQSDLIISVDACFLLFAVLNATKRTTKLQVISTKMRRKKERINAGYQNITHAPLRQMSWHFLYI